MAFYDVLVPLILLCTSTTQTYSSSSDVLNGPIINSLPDLSSKLSASPRIFKITDFETSPSIPSPILHHSPRGTSTHQFQWYHDGGKPDILRSNWYGFNQFVPRSARSMADRLRAANLLGESTSLYPMSHFSSSPVFSFNESPLIHPLLHDFPGMNSIPFHNYFQNPFPVTYDQAMNVPHRFSVPFIRQHHHLPQLTNDDKTQEINYQQPRRMVQRSSTAPTPVTIKIVPLKLSSTDLAKALKSMSWIPIPIDSFLKGNDNRKEEGSVHHQQQQVYSDKRQSEFDEESDLPPPSSHVATPPLGITYAEGQRSERFTSNNFQPQN